MATIPVRQARDGMQLLQDVCDGQGRVLLRAGERLQARHVEKLERLGVRTLDVRLSEPGEAPTPAAAEGAGPTPDAELDRAVAERFRRVQNDPVLAELAMVARRHARTLAPFTK